MIRTVEPGADIDGYISTSKSGLGRGGMVSKCGIARRTAAQGVEVIIANGKREGILSDLVLNEHSETVCTRFLPS